MIINITHDDGASQGRDADAPHDISRYVYVDVAPGGVSRRNNVGQICRDDGADGVLADGKMDWYVSHNRATEALQHWVSEHRNGSGTPTVAGFDGPVWADNLHLDFDDALFSDRSLARLRRVLGELETAGVELRAVRIYFSGAKGFHLELPHTLFGGFTPSADLHQRMKRAAKLLLGDIPFDKAVYNKLGLWRVENTRHSKTGFCKVRLTVAEARTFTVEQIQELARSPRDISAIPELTPVPDGEWWPVGALGDIWGAAGRGDVLPDAQPQEASTSHRARREGGRPGDDFIARAEWGDVLLPHGWTHVYRQGAVDYWRRPGKESGISATTNYANSDLLYVFSSSTVFEAGRAYNRFSAYAILNHDGDFSAAAAELRRQGFGSGAAAALLDRVPAFPLETLPTAFRDLVAEAAAALPCPPEFVAVPLLVAAGVAIGDALVVELKPGWCEGPNLYAAIVGDPGSKKSPAQMQAMRPIHRIQKRLAGAYAEEMERYRVRLAAWESAKKPERGPKPEPPVFRHVVTTDATTEAIASMLLASKGLLVAKDELAGWVRSMDQYRAGGKGADRQHYLSMWSRSPIKVDRKSSPEPIVVPRPLLGVVGGIQPDLLPELADAAGREDGFVDRLLWAYPDPVVDVWTTNGVSLETVQAVERIFDDVYDLAGELDEDGEPTPRIVRLSAEASALWAEWYAEHAAEMAGEDFPQRLRGPWAKMPGQLARLALILHAVWSEPVGAVDREVDAWTLGAAADLVDFFEGHARRAYRHLARQRRDRVVTLLQALKERGPMNQRAILHDVFKRNVPAAHITAMLEELEEAGLARSERRADTGGRPSTVWSAT